MATNPLQKYFRQPKVFIKLPSGGIYAKPGTIQGDVNHMPVYGMTGMDEIIMKTPDALLSGESTAAVMSSCCPNIKDAWEVSVTDVLLILTAIRISTYGNEMTVANKCPSCGADNEYALDLNRVVEHYMNCKYENTVVLDDVVVKVQPLTYRESTEFNLRNFRLQQQLEQVSGLEDEDQRQQKFQELFKQIGDMQIDILRKAIESVEAEGQVVTERSFIEEWIVNSDKAVVDSIKALNQRNNEAWATPSFKVQCDSCSADTELNIELDESNFFVKA
jgi:hypothetical protein